LCSVRNPTAITALDIFSTLIYAWWILLLSGIQAEVEGSPGVQPNQIVIRAKPNQRA